ncbi:MAG: mechanosensitive ion channel [Ardenticatenaceae bacterium]|nr:mechanosensitive ion channel [Ardenticatenaceae bacterium]
MTDIEELSLTLNAIYQEILLFLPKLIAALTIFVVGLYLVNLLIKLLVRALEKRRVPAEVTQFISNYGRWTLIILIVIVSLQQVDFDLTAFVAGLGILGFTIGFALQDITQNIISGLLLLVQRPFEIGDLVKIEEFQGYVTAIDIRTTTLRTLDGRDVLIPNYNVLTHPITNFTKDPDIRLGLPISISYDDDLNHIKDVTFKAVESVAFVMKNPAPEILYQGFADSAINLVAYFWINILETSEIQAFDGVLQAINEAYRREGIVIPYPISIELPNVPAASAPKQ